MKCFGFAGASLVFVSSFEGSFLFLLGVDLGCWGTAILSGSLLDFYVDMGEEPGGSYGLALRWMVWLVSA